MTVRYERKGMTITTITTDDEGKVTKKSEGFQFENEAKRASHKLQQSNGGLGMGVLKLIH